MLGYLEAAIALQPLTASHQGHQGHTGGHQPALMTVVTLLDPGEDPGSQIRSGVAGGIHRQGLHRGPQLPQLLQASLPAGIFGQ